MKKTLLTLMLAIVSAIVLNAQSLTGKQWFTKLTSEDDMEIVVGLTFEKNGTCELVMATEYEMKDDDVPIDFAGSVTVPGTYTLSGNDLKMNLLKRKAEAELGYDIKGMDARTKALLDKEIEADIKALKKEFKNDMLDGLPTLHNVKIVSLDSHRLIIKDDDGDEIPFYAE